MRQFLNKKVKFQGDIPQAPVDADTGSSVKEEAAHQDSQSCTHSNENQYSKESSQSRGSSRQQLGKESKHTDFYYKLEALNEKIKLFTEVFYSSKRADL